MEVIKKGFNTINNILCNVLPRLSSTDFAHWIVSNGRTYGKLLSPEDAFDILSITPIEIRDGILSHIECFMKFKKSLDKNDRKGFVELCETCDNVSDLLYSCGYISMYVQADMNIEAPDKYSFDESNVFKNAYVVGGYELNEAFLFDYLRKLIRNLPLLAPLMTKEEVEELEKFLLEFRSHKEYYSVILEEFIQYDPELRTIREDVIKKYGEDDVEREFLAEHSHKWHLPTDLEERENRRSFFIEMPEKTRDTIYSNIHGFENLIENIAACGLIEDTASAKNTLAQLLLGKDLGCSGNIPLPFRNPKILCYMIAKIYNHRGFSNLKKYFIWTTLNEKGKAFDTDKQCTSYVNSCEGNYRSIVLELFPGNEFPEK